MDVDRTVVCISKGHQLHEESLVLPEYRAFEHVIFSKHAYTTAKRETNGKMIRLIWHWYTCADCHHTFQIPDQATDEVTTDEADNVNSPGLNEDKPTLSSKSSFCDWALQCAFFGFNSSQDDFIFVPLPETDKLLTCPHCGFVTHTFSRSFKYVINSNPFMTTVTQNIEYSDKWIALPLKYSCAKQKVDFPLEASFLFNHKDKRTIFLLSDCGNNIIEIRNLEEQDDLLSGYLINTHISSDTPVKNTLAEIFSQFYEDSLPFGTKELNLEVFALLNRFQGFPKVFYNAIPFAGTGLRIDCSFAETASLLKRYADVPEVYKHYGLPEKKSIRRIIFDNPAFLFYARELVALPFYNTDIVYQILEAEGAFDFLSKLHSLPGIVTYLTALVNANGEIFTWKSIKNSMDNLENAAAIYLLLSKENKKLFLHKNFNEIDIFDIHTERIYNLPVPLSNRNCYPDCYIGKYYFCVLTNTHEYRKAAEMLQNCLANYWNHSSNIVVGIKKKHTYVAAIEVSGNRIEQACLAMNEPIETDHEVFKAFTQWVAINGLQY